MRQVFTVYLAGGIAGLTETEAKSWRHEFKKLLRKHNPYGGMEPCIKGIDPLRCEPALDRSESVYSGHGTSDPRFGTGRAIHSKNFFDVRQADFLLAYMPNTMNIAPVGHHSYGTFLEIGMAYSLRKPVILVSDDEALKEHAVLENCCSWILSSLEEAVELLYGLADDYNT